MVVLPEVPVIPTTVTRSDGFPYTVAASPPSTLRGAGCTSIGTVPARAAISAAPAASVSTATAPRSDRVGGIAGAVRGRAGQRGEQVAGQHVLGAQRHTGDRHVRDGFAVIGAVTGPSARTAPT